MTKPIENDKQQNIEPPFQNSERTNEASTPSIKTPKLSLKDYYLSEYDDHEGLSTLSSEQNQLSTRYLTKSWRKFLTLLTCLIAITSISAILVYLWVSDQTEEEEIKAARSLADIAMSLTYAQLKNIQPLNQNWSHPEFLRNNLIPILAPNYDSLTDLDAHGQFANCPYMLRIHSSSDLSQFLIIAQPCPSLLQWLIPKASIVIDLKAMELRKFVDLKPLNRLIVNSNNLHELSANEISHLVSQGELIPLSHLANKAENVGLVPPKALALIRPGAENHIYNAPRYYLLGERILNHSLDLASKFVEENEVNLLQQELNTLTHFPDLVLYTSGGIQHALKAQKALTSLIPNDKFLIAFLQLNSQGKIANSHLLFDDQTHVATTEIKKPLSELNQASERNLVLQPVDALEIQPIQEELPIVETEMDLLETEMDPLEIEDNPNLNMDHAIFLQLSSMTNARTSALKPIAEEMTELLNKQSLSSQPEFNSRLLKLQQKYNDMDKEELNKIFKKLTTLTQDYVFLPAVKFLEFIQAAGLRTIFQEYLLNIKKKKELQISNEQIEQQFQNIQASTTWQELEHHAAQMNQLLQFERIPDEARLVTFQNNARSITTQKLNQFILSSNEGLPANAFNPEYQQKLINIIRAAWITDPEIHDFYISEFELRTPEREE